MTQKVEISKNILEEIHREAVDNKKKNMETKGYLFGQYKKDEDSIEVISKHELGPVRNYSGGAFIDDLVNIFRGCKIHDEGREFIDNVKEESGGIFYSTKLSETEESGLLEMDLISYRIAPTFRLFDHGAFITYSSEEDRIKGYNEIGNEIKIETLE
ncbi:MAG: hypothetical protein ABEK36_01990 [Candidatus Aenigmatarchaeota archaeon]